MGNVLETLGLVTKKHPLSLQERKERVRRILEPYFTMKRDETLIALYERVAPGLDGRIHSEMNPVGTARGRYSSHESMVYPFSTNLQNLPKKIGEMDLLYRVRDIIVPDEGFVLGTADYVGAEALLASAFMRDWRTFDQMMRGEDVHAQTAAHFFGRSVEEYSSENRKANPERNMERHIAKQLRYASTYKASVWRLTQTLNANISRMGRKRFTQDEVRHLWHRLLEIVPLQRWWSEVQSELERNNNLLVNPLGFMCRFHNPDPERRLKEALAFYPQSTVASVIDMSMDQIGRELLRPGEWEILLQVHDEIVFQCRPKHFETTARRVKEIMEQRFVVYEKEVYIPAEIGRSNHSWGHVEGAWG